MQNRSNVQINQFMSMFNESIQHNTELLHARKPERDLITPSYLAIRFSMRGRWYEIVYEVIDSWIDIYAYKDLHEPPRNIGESCSRVSLPRKDMMDDQSELVFFKRSMNEKNKNMKKRIGYAIEILRHETEPS